MKKYLLAMMMVVATLGMAACSDDKEPAVEKEPEEVTEPVVVEPTEVTEPVEEPAEVVEEPAVVEEPKEEGTAAATLKYENSESAVQDGIMDTLENINTILVSGENHSFTIEVIKGWFSDFEGSDAQLDVYLAKLAEQGLTEKDLTDRHSTFKVIEKGSNDTTWNIELEMTGTAGAKKVVTLWKIIAQPGPTGDLVIDITEIK